MLALKGVQRDALRCSKRPQRHLPGTQEFPWGIQWGWRKIIPLPFLEQQDGSISPGILAKHFQGAHPEHLHQPFPKSPCFVLPKPPTVCSNQSHLRTGDGPCASQERGTQFPWLVSNPPKLHSMSCTHPVGASLGEAASTPSSQHFLSFRQIKSCSSPSPPDFHPELFFPAQTRALLRQQPDSIPAGSWGKGQRPWRAKANKWGRSHGVLRHLLCTSSLLPAEINTNQANSVDSQINT